MAKKTMTAPLAIIKVQTLTGPVAIGKMKDLRITETLRRGRVSGIGKLTPDELPATEWSGSLSCDFYLMDFKIEAIAGMLPRYEPGMTIEDFVNTVILEEEGIQLDIMRKEKVAKNPVTGIITSQLAIFATVKGAFITREGMNISEGQISGRNAEFEYINPIIYSI